jgi:imidazolonepropionase-like amidohydrolase
MTGGKKYLIVKAGGIVNPKKITDNKAACCLVIRDGTILDFKCPSDKAAGDKILDLTGFVLSPFFCDYHLHFAANAAAAGKQIAENLLQHGIKKVYEGGDSHLAGTEMKNLLKDRVEVKTSGYAIYKKGTYGKFIGKGVGSFHDAKELIDQLCQQGVDYIKVINSGIFKAETAKVTPGGFEQEELVEIVRRAKGKGLDVFCHANGEQAVREAVKADVSAIIHGLSVSDETLFMMSERKVAFIPTVNAFASLSLMTNDREIKTNISRAVETHLLAIRKAVDSGVRVLPGSDSGPEFIPYGKAYLEELRFFKKAGLSDEYILTSAVDKPFAKGMKADFLALKGLEVKKVFINGDISDPFHNR